MKKIYFALFFLASISSKSQVTVASIFADNMVLQRHVKIPVWGFAKANERIAVKFHNQTKKTIANKDGKWSVYLDNESAGGPFILTVIGKSKIEIKNILVGEVWLCSGQSNMEWNVGQSDNSKDEISNANFPTIRHIKIPKVINSIPNSDFIKTEWQICSPKTVTDFSGIGYFYAKDLTQKLNIPIGLINTSWGGTNIETWISREGFENSEEFKAMIAQMPKIDLNTLINLKMKTAEEVISVLQKSKFSTKNVPFYKNVDFNDTSWLELQQPGIWEEQSLGNFDGVVWLRKHFALTENITTATLEIPAIDDNDETFVNGIKVGETSGWDKKRSYQIPTDILKIGDNVIAIRVTDNGGGGGIHGNEENLKLITPTNQIPLSGTWKFQVESIKNGVNENEFPSLCYNAMINPLIPFAFKGVLWYQGESNASRAYQYNKAFPLLIEDWRAKFKSNFPFYFVQLASFVTKGNSNEGCSWAELREAQTNTLKIKNTAMVVTTDLVKDPTSIHPTNKQDVGKRLAAIAFNNLYKEIDSKLAMVCSGPTFKSMKINNNAITLTFDNIGSGLKSTGFYNALAGFEVAGENQKFYPAKAILLENKVYLSCENVSSPKAIRFGWIGDASEYNLFNQEGFPAVPFRTDDWELSTEKMKYTIQNHK